MQALTICTYDWLVTLDPGDDRLESFVLLSLPQVTVDVGHEGLDLFVHECQVAALLLAVRLLEDGLEQERVFGESLHRTDENVEQAKAIAIPLRFAPLY